VSLRDDALPGEQGGISQREPVDVGERLRKTRLRRRMTLRQVAERAGLTQSYISQLERGRVNGSIGSLQRIAAALGTTMAELFEPADSSPVRVVRKDARPTLVYGILGRKFLLTPTPLEHLEVFIGRFDPGGSTGEELYSHGDSDELFLVLSGSFELAIGDTRLTLADGDCVNYRSSLPHRAVNVGTGIGEVMWIVSPPSM
jgi:transcriptional regulator with XRE-family HTH domain